VEGGKVEGGRWEKMHSLLFHLQARFVAMVAEVHKVGDGVLQLRSGGS
jgi:hypothetical protein